MGASSRGPYEPTERQVVNFDTGTSSGIKVEGDWGWRDIEGLIYPDPANPSQSPTVALFKTGLYAYAYSNGDYAHFSFHLPHDWAYGTDLYIHVHWAHNATDVAANTLDFSFDVSYSKGHNQEIFPDPITISNTYALTDISTTPRYRHNVTEVQLSTSGGAGGTLIDTDDIEVDGLVIGTMTMGIPANSFTGGTPDEAVYIFTIDCHYQTTNIGTKNRTPNFYT